jgi:iron complex transport system ATP-binding protein
VVIVLHDLNLALNCADEVVVMEQGEVRQVGTPEEVYRSGVLEQVFRVKVRAVETEKGKQYLFFSK